MSNPTDLALARIALREASERMKSAYTDVRIAIDYLDELERLREIKDEGETDGQDKD